MGYNKESKRKVYNMKYLKYLVLILTCTFITGCTQKVISYEEISQEEAKKLMDMENCVILDVRSSEEFSEGHIENAINIDYEEIKENAEGILTDKNALILVYCRSGRRSKIAAQSLVELGYTNVKEFGGINTWQY